MKVRSERVKRVREQIRARVKRQNRGDRFVWRDGDVRFKDKKP